MDAEKVVRRMRAGAGDYVVKPVDRTRLFVTVWNALATLELRREAKGFREGRARGQREGLLKKEANGTILLEEIGNLEPRSP